MKLSSIFSSKHHSPWRFLLWVLLFLSPVAVPFLLFYFSVYQDFAYKGDLTRLGMIPFEKSEQLYFGPRPPQVFDSIHFDQLTGCDNASDIWVIGDSFANKQKEWSFQTYMKLALDTLLHTDRRVLTVDRLDYEPHQVAAHLLLTLDTLPRVMVLESVERGFVGRACDMQFRPICMQPAESSGKRSAKKSVLSYWQEFCKKNLQIDNPVYRYDLKFEAFTSSYYARTLFYYKDDVVGATDESVRLAALKLDTLNQLARSRGVKLVMFVASDKYCVYQDFIANADHPLSNIATRLESCVDDDIIMFNPQRMLSAMVASGEKDVYHCGDTHWSPKGARVVGDSLARLIVGLDQ